MSENSRGSGDPTARSCSFCEKLESEAGRLIESPGTEGASPVFICASCVELCSSLLERETQKDRDIAEALSAQVKTVLSDLDDVEFRIIELRYGLADGYSYNHEEIAGMLKLSAEDVQKIEAAAVAKLHATDPGGVDRKGTP